MSMCKLKKDQVGATLIVSLVILAVITILGVASMRASNLELRMAASARDRAVAFQAAESALGRVESFIDGNLTIENVLPSCTTNNCFSANCNNGLCFTGDLQGAVNQDDCRLTSATGELKQPWKQEDNWADTSLHRTMSVLSPGLDESGDFKQIDVRYMIEFLCFVPRDEKAIDDGENSRNNGVPLYRVTVRASGDAGRSAVALQSVYRARR
ncbi:MAG TPA: PilX N-terminal domain-containing pilus assembly protein [Cellvibrio sp.]|nr:PilX N-terminal domain-containing pilus assembly protein [Cellvibrio sp.]